MIGDGGVILSRGFRGGDWGELVSVDELRRVLRLDDSRIWLLIGLCVALVFTIQSVETATEGAWPHQRRPNYNSISVAVEIFFFRYPIASDFTISSVALPPVSATVAFVLAHIP